MPEKKKPLDRKHTSTALVAFAMTMLLTLWNMFASQDRSKPESASPAISTLEKELSNACSTSMPNMGTGTRCMSITRTRSS